MTGNKYLRRDNFAVAGDMMERRSKDGTGSGDLKTEETKGQWLE